VNRHRFRARGGRLLTGGGGEGGGADAIDGPGQVDGRRPGLAQERGGTVEGCATGFGRELEGDAVGAGDADERGAANGETGQRIGDGRSAPEGKLLLAPGELGLVQRPQGRAVEAKRYDAGPPGAGRDAGVSGRSRPSSGACPAP
jgi:hypothetical protein